MRPVFLLFLFMIFFSAIADNQPIEQQKDITVDNQNNTEFTYKIIHSIDSTWCYDIYKNGKMLIHQRSIPGLPGNAGFKNKSDAKKVARLVINKLIKGEMPPSVSIEELKKLKVL